MRFSSAHATCVPSVVRTGWAQLIIKFIRYSLYRLFLTQNSFPKFLVLHFSNSLLSCQAPNGPPVVLIFQTSSIVRPLPLVRRTSSVWLAAFGSASQRPATGWNTSFFRCFSHLGRLLSRFFWRFRQDHGGWLLDPEHRASRHGARHHRAPQEAAARCVLGDEALVWFLLIFQKRWCKTCETWVIQQKGLELWPIQWSCFVIPCRKSSVKAMTGRFNPLTNWRSSLWAKGSFFWLSDLSQRFLETARNKQSSNLLWKEHIMYCLSGSKPFRWRWGMNELKCSSNASRVLEWVQKKMCADTSRHLCFYSFGGELEWFQSMKHGLSSRDRNLQEMFHAKHG